MGSIPTCGALEVWQWTSGSRTVWLVEKSAGQPQFVSYQSVRGSGKILDQAKSWIRQNPGSGKILDQAKSYVLYRIPDRVLTLDNKRYPGLLPRAGVRNISM